MTENIITKCLLVTVVFSTVFFSCSNSKNKDENENTENIVLPDADNLVKVKTVEIKDFNRDIVSNGIVSAAKKADLRFEQPDVIEHIYVKNGQRVAVGQKIASLDRFNYQNELDQASDALKQARLELQDVLIGQGYTLEDSVNVPKAIMELARVRSGYDKSIIQFRLADHNLKNTVLYAPFSGIIANLFTQEHNIPASDEPFCTVLATGSFNVDFSVLESELQLIQSNNKVRVMPVSYNGKVAEGRITEINPLVDKNGMVKIQAGISQTGGMKLYDGMNVRVQIQKLLAKQLTIPKEALVLRNNKEVVFTYENGKAQWNYVTVGGENASEYMIAEGLNEGDQVIYDGNVNLAHETVVKVTE
ncbi:efflux RND transporter periplasmic adaptor subunit [Albibacterium indicum]|uniref:efflux RND transporter periplasmic adaptor subunit n=1 Tax=Albibacterium indicum TaxID=2292082 RepID=UPI000E4E4528|nr:efflux RND transporter periplasmic adaptor subunit [Pedobacter indicus]